MTLLRFVITIVLLLSTPLLAMDELETMPTALTLKILENIEKDGFLRTVNGEYKPRHKEMVSTLLKLFRDTERLSKITLNKVLPGKEILTFSLTQPNALVEINGLEFKERKRIILPSSPSILYIFVLIKKN
jgi:hypothetical protein